MILFLIIINTGKLLGDKDYFITYLAINKMNNKKYIIRKFKKSRIEL